MHSPRTPLPPMVFRLLLTLALPVALAGCATTANNPSASPASTSEAQSTGTSSKVADPSDAANAIIDEGLASKVAPIREEALSLLGLSRRPDAKEKLLKALLDED